MPSEFDKASYKKGAYIMIEGKQEKTTFFIILTGKVQLLKEGQVYENNAQTILGPGDFFGVISCMSGHPRIETAQAVTDVVIIIIQKSQFPNLLAKSPAIILKIIKYFSNKLRSFDETLTKLKFKNETEDDPSLLFEIGEYYRAKKQYNLAIYGYIRYVQYVPQGPSVDDSKKYIAELQSYANDPMNQNSTKEGLIREYKDGTFIFSEHELGNELFVIQENQVKITKVVKDNEIIIAILKPGEIFGEMAILNNKPRGASAIAYGDVKVMAISSQNFNTMVQTQPQMAITLLSLLSERVWTSYRQLANELISDPLGKIYDTLLTQLLRKKIIIEHNKPYTFEFGPKEVIKMVGIDEAEGKNLIKELLKSKKLELTEDQKIECTDIEEIEKQVNYYKNKELRERKIEAQQLRRGI